MTTPRHRRIRELFRLIAVENDPARVQALAGELGRLLMIQAPLPEPSGQQLRIIELVARGLKNREIAEKLGMSRNVVRNYISKVYDTVRVNNRVQLALWYESRVHEQKLLRPSS
jgi:DNA-binding NarL/FixJ family response regulator